MMYIANMLDDAGFYSQADEVDLLIEKTAAIGKGTKMFIDDLKSGLARAVDSDDFPAITEEVLRDVNKAVDELAEHGRFYADMQPDPEGFYEEMEEGVVPLVRDALGLEGSIRELQQQIKETDDPAKVQQIKDELNRDQKRYDKLMEEVNKLKHGKRPSDLEKYEKYETMLNQRRSELGWT